MPKVKQKFCAVTCAIVLLLTIFSFNTFAEKALAPEKNFGIIARIITAVLAGEHYIYKSDEKKLSKEFFKEYLNSLDPNHIYFTETDITYLKQAAGPSLYNKLQNGDTSFAFIAYNKLLLKVEEREKYTAELIKKGFDFTKNENYIFDRSKLAWANSNKELDEIWRKKIKNDILTFRLMNKINKEKKGASDKKEKKKSKIIKSPEDRVLKRLKSYRLYLAENEPIDVLEIYLSTLSHIYDPHSSYLSPRSSENFNIQMQLSFVGIGALLSSEDGYTKVEKIIPGGPAEKANELEATDRIIAVGESEKNQIDIIDMPLSKVVNKIRGKKGTNVYLTVLKGSEGTQAIPKIISIKRNVVKLKDSEASASIEDIKDSNGVKHKIGIITLPSFYYDFQGAFKGEKDFKSSTRDVRKILDNFKKEKVDGVVIDLRSNGGGSLKEAIELTGLFIKKGPVVQTKNSRGKVYVEEDPNTQISYDGPLLVLVNKLSASAAEIFAGAIQDYKRGVIVGDKSTHGKGTVQTVVDLARVLSRFNLGFNPGSIKLTNAKFYRVNGSSTQNKGINPDITFHSFTDFMDLGENSLDHALPWDAIEPVSYDESNRHISEILPELKNKSSERQQNSDEFNKLNDSISLFHKLKEKKDISLNEEKRWNEYQEEKKVLDKQKDISKIIAINNTRIDKDDKDKKGKDLFLNESINILSDYIDYLNSIKSNEKKIAIN
ncbi:MAG TPA: carboxy terminal-processing peptidase [Victivallales bacterium]|nr:carboxy terminal-processing peptidase [Victivallales bacterium]